ncbi:MAG: hypothetical protein ACFB16_23535 [Phormidesmis sp.]
MNNLFHIGELFPLARLRRLVLVLAVSLVILLLATACSPADTGADVSVSEPTSADVEQAQSQLSDDAVNMDNLSRQTPQKRVGGTAVK